MSAITNAFKSLGPIFRPWIRKGIWHWLRFVALLCLGSYIGHLFSGSAPLTDLRYAAYFQQLRLQQRGQVYPRNVALVLLEDDDYWGPAFQSRTPLKRDQLARILQKLNAADVNLMALDVDLRAPRPQTPDYEFPDYTAEDSTLFDAINQVCASHHHIVLSSSIDYVGGYYVEVPSIYAKPLAHQPCVSSGYIQLPYDMRRIPGSLILGNDQQLDSMALAITRQQDPAAYQSVSDTDDGDHGFRFADYLTAADFAPRDGRQFIFTGTDLDRLTAAELHAQLGNRIVLIGANWHANAYGKGPTVDSHASPGGDEPGVMLHANYVEAMLDSTGTFAPMSDSSGEILEIALALLLALIGALEIHSGWKWAAFVVGIFFSVLLTYVLLQNLGLFLDFAIPLLILFGHTLAEKVVDMWVELREHEKAAHAAKHHLPEPHAAEPAIPGAPQP